MVHIAQLARFFVRTMLAIALVLVCVGLRNVQAQNLNAQKSSTPESGSASGASKEAANPLANAWLMQIQQNNKPRSGSGGE